MNCRWILPVALIALGLPIALREALADPPSPDVAPGTVAPGTVAPGNAVQDTVGEEGAEPAAEPVEEAAPPDTTTPSTYADSIQAQRDGRIARLMSDTGWLTVTGLFWLSPGENTFGTDTTNAIVLPAGSTEGHAGSFRLERTPTGERIVLHPDAAAGIRIMETDSVIVTDRVLAGDDTGRPDMLEVGRLTLFVIKRGDRFAIRMRDPESSIRKNFVGIDFYQPDSTYRVEATFEPFDPPRTISVPNIAGYADSMVAPGVLRFTLAGEPCTLTPVVEDSVSSILFLIFSDETTEIETYGGGRFLYADAPRDGRTVLDFNLAYNPPCAFTPFTTCPMPPEGNDLPTAIEAGEKKYRGHE